jgi:hypothetical protein
MVDKILDKEVKVKDFFMFLAQGWSFIDKKTSEVLKKGTILEKDVKLPHHAIESFVNFVVGQTFLEHGFWLDDDEIHDWVVGKVCEAIEKKAKEFDKLAKPPSLKIH